MLPHPFKTDTWVEGERSGGENLCNEVGLPMSGADWCTLGMKPSMIRYLALGNYIHQTQVHGRVWELIGDSNLKLINSFYSGATPDQLMDPQEVLDLARELYEEHEEDPTSLYNTLGALRAIYLNEKAKLLGSFAFQQTLKEKGIMTASTEQLDVITKLTGQESDGGLKRGELTFLQAANTGKSLGTEELATLIGEAGDRGIANPKGPTLTSLENPRKIKRKKSKPKSNHLPNMRNARTKRVLGATILNMLGKVQQDTQDSYKRSLLKEIPLADFVELATGDKLPDYQANLLNAMQAKADPTAPIVERVNAGIVPVIKEHIEAIQPMLGGGVGYGRYRGGETIDDGAPVAGLKDLTEEQIGGAVLGRGQTSPILTFDDAPEQLSNEARQAIFEQNIDNALARYVTPSVFPEGTTDEFRADIIAQVKAAVIERNMSIDQQTLVTEAMSIVHPLETIVA